MTAAIHRQGEGGDHSKEREWTGPSESQWDALCCTVEKISKKQDIQHTALFGEEREGINSDGGIVGEVRNLRKIRVVAWSGLTGLLGLIAKTFIDSITMKAP